jgi:hypothetical protein
MPPTLALLWLFFEEGLTLLPKASLRPWSSYLCHPEGGITGPAYWMRWVVTNFLPGLASSQNFSYFNLLSSYDYRQELLYLSIATIYKSSLMQCLMINYVHT